MSHLRSLRGLRRTFFQVLILSRGNVSARITFSGEDHFTPQVKWSGRKDSNLSGNSIEDVVNQKVNDITKGGYPSNNPQELVSSCPDLAVVLLNWDRLSRDTKDAILVLVCLGGEGVSCG